MTIWELRSPALATVYIRGLAQFHFDMKTRNLINKFLPLGNRPYQFSLRKWIIEWGQAAEARLPKMRKLLQKLIVDSANEGSDLAFEKNQNKLEAKIAVID